MAKKKLFGNVKEPRCETCAHGKLSANGDAVLCIRGGALPLHHSCRRYQYDPLRRVPKRRPLLGEYSAADFALDEQVAAVTAPPTDIEDATEVVAVPALTEAVVQKEPTVESEAVETAEEAVESTVVETVEEAVELEVEEETIDESATEETTEETVEPETIEATEKETVEETVETAEKDAETADATTQEESVESEADETTEEPAQTNVPSRSTFESLFEYLHKNEKPDAETIMAILSKTYQEADKEALAAPNSSADELEKRAAEATAALNPDDTPDILSDLDRLDIRSVPSFVLAPLDETSEAAPLLLLDDDAPDDVVFIASADGAEEAPLSADDLVFLPKGTPSDYDGKHVADTFTPLTGNE